MSILDREEGRMKGGKACVPCDRLPANQCHPPDTVPCYLFFIATTDRSRTAENIRKDGFVCDRHGFPDTAAMFILETVHLVEPRTYKSFHNTRRPLPWMFAIEWVKGLSYWQRFISQKPLTHVLGYEKWVVLRTKRLLSYWALYSRSRVHHG